MDGWRGAAAASAVDCAAGPRPRASRATSPTTSTATHGQDGHGTPGERRDPGDDQQDARRSRPRRTPPPPASTGGADSGGGLPRDAGGHAAGQHPGDADGDDLRPAQRQPTRDGDDAAERGRRPTSAHGEAERGWARAASRGTPGQEPTGTPPDRVLGPAAPVPSGTTPVRRRMHTRPVCRGLFTPAARARTLEAGRTRCSRRYAVTTSTPIAPPDAADVDVRPTAGRARRASRPPRSSSAWTARSAASARSGGPRRRRPGGTLPCGSCTPPPAPRRRARGGPGRPTRPARDGGSPRRRTPSPSTPRPGVRSVTEVVAGDAAKVLLTAAAEGQLVVLGKSTTGAADEWVLAPVAVRVAARSPRPVVLVPRPRGATSADRPVAAVLGRRGARRTTSGWPSSRPRRRDGPAPP